MKKLLVFVLLAPLCAFGTVVTASGNASVSSGTNWVGGVAPNCTTDAIATAGFTVTDDVPNCIFGSKASGVGPGVNVSASGGKFQCAAGISLTFRGFDTTTNFFWKNVANATMDLSNCVNVTYDGPGDYGANASKGGPYIDAVTTISDAATSSFAWSNASGTRTYTGVSWNAWDLSNNLYIFKLETSALADPGPISNAAGNGLGSCGDTSLTISSGGFSGSTSHEVCSLALVLANGDYYHDYNKGVIIAKSASNNLTITLTFKYGTWFSWGIVDTANTANNSTTVNGTYRHCGLSTSSSESTGACWNIDNKYALGMGHDTQALTFGTGVVFEHCQGRCIQIFASSIAGSESSAAHHYTWTSPTFNNAHWVGGNFNGGLIQGGWFSFFDLTNPVLNSFTNLWCGSPSRGPMKNVVVSGANGGGSTFGHILTFKMLPPPSANSSYINNGTLAAPLNGFQNPDGPLLNLIDGSMFNYGGNAALGPNTYSGNYTMYAYRAGRLDNWMVVTNNFFAKTNHHAFIFASRSGYFDASTITFSGNITADASDTGNFPGGITTSYNQTDWIDSFTATHNTFDSGTRCIDFNDFEGSITLNTRSQYLNNICSNNVQGIYYPTPNSTNLSNLAIARNDYNLDYNNTTNPTNINQGTFVRNGAEYNTGTRNLAGVYVYSPTGYTLPDATSRSLVSTVSGTVPTNFAINIAWSGGAAVNFVQAQGTLTAVTNTGSNLCTAPSGGSIVCPILTDSGASFTTTGSGLKGYEVIFTSGTGAPQYAMVFSNTATALTVFPNVLPTGCPTACALPGFSPAPDTTTKYIVIKPHQQLFDSGAVNSILAGIHAPTLVLTSQTDSGITLTKNYPTATNPAYVNSANPTYNFHPRFAGLKGTASDGGDIGALAPIVGTGSMLLGVYP